MKKNKQKPALLQKPVEKKPRVLIFDIETAPAVAYVWRTGKQVVDLEKIQTPSSIISIAWKWWGEKETHYLDTFNQEDKRDDIFILAKFYEVLMQATAWAGHNCAAFDVQQIKGRMWHHGFPPLRPTKVLDTLTMSRQAGTMLSHKLLYLTKDLSEKKSSHGKFPGMSLWIEYLKGNPEARQEMEDYNRQDVISNEKLFDALLPYARHVSGLVPITGEGDLRCPRCASGTLHPRGFTQTQAGRYQRYKCGGCGGWSQSRYLVREDRKGVLKSI